jgi:hypothetical protein
MLEQVGEEGFFCEVFLSLPEPSLFEISLAWHMEVQSPSLCSLLHVEVLGKLPSIDNLRKRNMVIVNRCCLCKNDAESVDHLFLHCKLAKELWDSVLSSFGVSWVMPCQVRMLVDCWQGGLGRQRNSLIWKVIPHCLMWCLWRERNLRSFEDLEMCSQDLKLFFFPDPY